MRTRRTALVWVTAMLIGTWTGICHGQDTDTSKDTETAATIETLRGEIQQTRDALRAEWEAMRNDIQAILENNSDASPEERHAAIQAWREENADRAEAVKEKGDLLSSLQVQFRAQAADLAGDLEQGGPNRKRTGEGSTGADDSQTLTKATEQSRERNEERIEAMGDRQSEATVSRREESRQEVRERLAGGSGEGTSSLREEQATETRVGRDTSAAEPMEVERSSQSEAQREAQAAREATGSGK